MSAVLRVSREPWLGTSVLSYPDRVPTVCDALDHAVTHHPDANAFEVEGTAVTYREFAELVEGAVAALRRWGVRPSDRVGVAAPNSLGLAVALFACARGGFVMVGLGTALQPPRWETMLRHSRAVVVLGAPAQMDGVTVAAEGIDGVAVHDLAALVDCRLPWSYRAEDRPDEASTYAVVYTSGTTGAPKGSQVVHRASMHSAHTYQALLDLAPSDRTAVWFPLTYISAMHAHVLPAMLVGATSVLLAAADGRRFLGSLRDDAITWTYTVPSMWQKLLGHRGFAAPALDGVRVAGFGGSPFPRGALDGLQAVLRNARLLDIYGLTETHSPAIVRVPEDHSDKLGSAGRPLPCVEARCVDGDGRLLDGAVGHLQVRSSLVTTGYLDAPEATAEAIVEGWLRTGDLARIDEDGYVWLRGRAKDVIDRGGNSIYAAEVEELLISHPDIDDAAVVGIPGRSGTEHVACMVVAAEGCQPSLPALRRWVVERLAVYAAPRFMEVTDVLPRNPTGKLDKARIRAAFSGS